MIKTKYRYRNELYNRAVLWFLFIFSVYIVARGPLCVDGEDSLRQANLNVTAGVSREISNVVYETFSGVDVVKNDIEFSKQGIEDSENFVEVNKTMYTTTVVNLRREASTDANIITRVGFAKEVYIDGYYDGSDWYKVQYNGVDGYMSSKYLSAELPATKVSSTAYYDQYNRASASGRPLIEGHSVAGMIAWLGKSIEIYKCNDDGTVGDYIGTYTFDDTGYGAESGVGESVILDGRTIGTIENGTCIDIYMETYEQCMDYGRQNIYIRFLE